MKFGINILTNFSRGEILHICLFWVYFDGDPKIMSRRNCVTWKSVSLRYKTVCRRFDSLRGHWYLSLSWTFRQYYDRGVDSTYKKNEYHVYLVGVKAASASVSAKFGISDLLLVLFIFHGFRENQCKEDNAFLKSVNEITLIFYSKTLRRFENKEHLGKSCLVPHEIPIWEFLRFLC